MTINTDPDNDLVQQLEKDADSSGLFPASTEDRALDAAADIAHLFHDDFGRFLSILDRAVAAFERWVGLPGGGIGGA